MYIFRELKPSFLHSIDDKVLWLFCIPIRSILHFHYQWEVESEDFSILKLTRGNVGSRSHFVLHLAKRTNLNSKPGFPAPKSGLCKSTLLFKRGKNEMRNSSKPALNKLANCLRKYPKQIIKITGHTDPLKPNYGEGSKYSNVSLGLKRAEALMKSLIAMKFNSGRFIVVSKGSMDPVAIGRLLGYINDYLGLVAMIAVFLAGIGAWVDY